jgi:hypothetical protein
VNDEAKVEKCKVFIYIINNTEVLLILVLYGIKKYFGVKEIRVIDGGSGGSRKSMRRWRLWLKMVLEAIQPRYLYCFC